jgi:urease accessory protein
MVESRLISLLHFADGVFPAGGYAHSFGLESYCQSGLVRDATELMSFLVAQLEGSSGPCDATAAVGALRAFSAGDLDACRELDDTLEAMKPVREFREGSRQMGRQTLRVAAHLTGNGPLLRYLAEVNGGRAPGHHATVLGMAGSVLGWTELEVATVFLYSTTALLVGAALRLLRIGQTEGQGVLWALQATIARLAEQATRRNAADLCSFTPALEIAGMRHERLEARLFRS